jgi:2-C-methyl-D-erythritol 4-phosphate cytidylyltransferase/2-C-methyl-D-erythritol 2,4-cyclodiphosphate synthase
VPKQLLTVAGESMLERSVKLFASHPDVDEIVVALPADLAADPPAYLCAPASRIRVVAGGVRRQDSVANAFAAVSDDSELIVIHDAARPFATPELISRTIAAAAESGAAVAALPARDTVKLTQTIEGSTPLVTETLPRDAIFLAQTPQAFRRRVLRDALALAGIDATDEASLAERAGYRVRIVVGESSNIKVTTPDDLPIAELIAGQAGRVGQIGQVGQVGQDRTTGAGKPARTGRAGTGYDLHRLAPGRRLMIGGVEVPSDRGPVAHSDGDVVCHAIVDAILGAAGLGDIGQHFPDNDPRWKDAPGVDLLARAVALVAARGFEVGNVDATVVLESPKIRDHVDAMRRTIAATIGIDADRVSVKGKTNEGLDAVGRGEAIAAHAVAIIRASSRA